MPRRSKTVLLIDDDENSLAGWSLFLQEVGYKVMSTTSALEGLELFGTQMVDAVVLDYSMPEMDGAEASATMKRIKPEVPIILFSGYDVPEPLLRTVDLVLAKGLPAHILVTKIDSLLKISETHVC